MATAMAGSHGDGGDVEEKTPHVKAVERQLPEWEHVHAANHAANHSDGSERSEKRQNLTALAGGFKAALLFKLDKILPPHKQYTKLNLTRKTIITTTIVTMLFITAMIAGLAAGLPVQDKPENNKAAASFSGDLTTFTPGPATAPGACGIGSSDSEYVAAIAHALFDQGGTANPNNNPHCSKMIKATHAGKTVTVKVVDRCAGCSGTYDLDLAFAPFQALTGAATRDGRFDITWDWA